MIDRIISWIALGCSAFLLIASCGWLALEAQWRDGYAAKNPTDAFTTGTIGLEVLPLKYVAVLRQVSADSFLPRRKPGDVWARYGFITPDSPPAKTCISNIAEWGPVGIAVSNYVPTKAFQTSTKFAGLTCAACHTARLRLPNGAQGPLIVGLGNQELDITAWFEGLRSAVLDPALTTNSIMSVYDAQCAEIDAQADDRPFWLTRQFERQVDFLIITAWLNRFRETARADLSEYDLPFAASEIHTTPIGTPAQIPAGPGRTRPFQSVVQATGDLAGERNYVQSKIPAVWAQGQDMRPWAQYDGSIRSAKMRGMIAAYTSGASTLALSKPDIISNVEQAAAFTETLAIPAKYTDLFDHPDPDDVKAGFTIYMKHCNQCHGHRPLEGPVDGQENGAAWSFEGAIRIHQISDIEVKHSDHFDVKTDPERVTFRFAQMMPEDLYTSFPGQGDDLTTQKKRLAVLTDQAQTFGKPALSAFWMNQLKKLEQAARRFPLGHPLAFPREELRAKAGYINNPIQAAWLRAPYLHNGSVPTLRQLINLERRPEKFCRGANPYDPDGVGLFAPAPENGRCPPGMDFLFDTSARGNSAGGHDYPWAYDNDERSPDDLHVLFAYLKTL